MGGMAPVQYLSHATNSHGYVSPTSTETMWKDQFQFLYPQGEDENNGEQGRGGGEKDIIFPLVLYPHTSGMAHVIGMIDCVITWLKAKGDEIKFVKYEDCARVGKVSRRYNVDSM
jgi:hypothetical protein